jgi:hypothetical protein
MEPRAETQNQYCPAETALPKWKLKANWILRQYARIWCLRDNIYSINFDVAFKDVFVQLFIDEGMIEKDAECCITFAYNEYCVRHGREPRFFTKSDKWKWISENGLFSFLKSKFLTDETIENIFYVARYTEATIGQNENFIFNFRGPWIDYEYCLALPCLPPKEHEWVDDPWERLGK